MLIACYILNTVPNRRSSITPYELWNKRKPNLSDFKIWDCRALVRVMEPKKIKLGERGIEHFFIGYIERIKTYRFMVTKKMLRFT